MPERVLFYISERELGLDPSGDDDDGVDVDNVPNKLDHADVEDDGRDGVHAHDVGDGHDGHDDRP